MKALELNYLGHTRLWWLVLMAGIVMVMGGFAYWYWPQAGYAVASQVFGWLLVAAGVVQLCVASGRDRQASWGWWLAGGMLDLLIGFMLVRSVVLSEAVLPYFLALIFLFWGFESLVAALSQRRRRLWWLRMVNGLLMVMIGFFFIEAGWIQNAYMVSFLAAAAFIYWGFAIAMAAWDLRPAAR
jgi:uncharacterized membrane protein HdeD (DUF308 family)